MFKRKLFKRALPVILSVAMIFQSTPATALAAENVETEAIVETAEGAEPSDDSSDAGSADSSEPSEVSPASEDAPTADGNSEEQAKEETEGQSTETTKAEESKNDESKAETAQTEESKEEGTSTEASKTEEAPSETVAENQGTETTTTAAEESTEAVVEATSEVEADGEAADVNAELAAAQIVIDKSALESNFPSGNLNYKDGVVSGSYDPEGELFDNFVNNTLKSESQTIISVKVGDQVNKNLLNKLAFQWNKVEKQEGAEDKLTALPAGETPKDAGSYRLVISLAAIDGVCTAAENVSIDFEIKQVELNINYEGAPEVGSTIADFVKNFKESYILFNEKENTYEYDDDGNLVVLSKPWNKEVYVKDVKIVVKDSVSGTEITDETTLFEKGKDYSYTVSVELTDANYTVKDLGVIDLNLKGDIHTEMEVTLPKNIEYTYGDEVKLPVVGTDYTVRVFYNDENGDEVDIEVPAEGITAQWLDADGNVLVDADGKEITPVDAGTYYVLLTYTDGTGRYEECSNGEKDNKDNIIKTNIPVTINPVSIYIKPALANTEYTDGKTVADILQDVTYDLFKTTGDTQLTASEFDKKTGWGVSYNKENETQYYEPVFELQVSEVKLDEEGNPKKDKDGKLEYDEYRTVEQNEKLIGDSELAKYRVVFSGNKAVYYGGGWEDKALDINDGANSAVPNYKVDVTPETISKYAVDLTITKTNTVIDITKYTECTDGVWKKIFDYTPFYEDRASYKKATVDNSSEGLSYRWYQAEKKDIKDEAGNIVRTEYVQGEDEIYDFQYTYFDGTTENFVSPVQSGTYMLVISYVDPKHEKSAEDVQLIYEIERQKIAAEVATGTEGNKVTAYSDVNIYDFINKMTETLTKTVKKADGNDLSKLVEDELLSLWEYGEQYSLEPLVEREDNITKEWKEVELSDTFLEGGHYRISFGVNVLYCDYPIYDIFQRNYQGYDMVETEDGTIHKYYPSNYIDVTVEAMGTTPLELKVDESLIGTMTKVYDGMPFAVPTGAVTVYNKNTGELVSDIALEYKWFDYDNAIHDYIDADEAINGGKYTLYAYFEGNSVYAPLDDFQIGEDQGFEITKREISVVPVLKDKIEAGTSSNALSEIAVYAYDKEKDEDVYLLDISGDILNTETISDMEAFGNPTWVDANGEEHLGYKAILSYNLAVKNADGTSVDGNVLKAEKNYYVESNVVLRASYSSVYNYNRNYKVTNGKAEFTPVRGSASVSKVSVDGVPATSLKDFMGTDTADEKVITHKIMPREGIPYVLAKKSDIKDDKGKNVGGNLFVFRIRAPKEFYKYGNYGYDVTNALMPVFENEIRKCGGYVLTTEEEAKSNGIIYVAFKTEGNNETASFTVRWSDGYLEKFTVDFTGAVLEADLTKAVAPKSLAFNTPVKKMVVGEKQQLDVKVTKKKLDDTICLKYETDNTSVLSVSETGAVVALDKGSATVKAIPCYLDEDGVKQEIAGAKAATAKISVVDVTAPKIKSVTAMDTYATVRYPKLADGYRREIYVLEMPKAKEDDFTTAIEKLKNGDWKSAGFAAAPIYLAGEYTDQKTKLSEVTVQGLTANTQYTIYVRNVSGIRQLADGGKVAASAKGAVKSFKTTASQVKRLDVTFEEKYWVEDYLINEGAFVADVSDGKIPAAAVGVFKENAKNANANDEDEIEYMLPFAKGSEELKYYAQPKLSFFAVNHIGSTSQPNVDNTLKIGNSYYNPSTIAKVDKKGNITLLGEGVVYIGVYDAVTGKCGFGELNITAKATKMTIAKNAKVRVGEAIRLEDYVTYFVGRKKLTNYYPALRREDITISGDTDAFSWATADGDNGTYIIAKEPRKTITVTVKDARVAANEGTSEGTIKITSKDIEAVKNLKVSEVVDKYATVSFTYPASAFEYQDSPATEGEANQLYFRIQVLDAAKNVVSDEYCHSYYWDEDGDMVSDDGTNFDNVQYDSKKKLYTFTKYIGLDNKPLNRKSSYTVSVTATYLKNEATSKAANKGFKTTDIPAAYQYEYGNYLGYDDTTFWPYSTEANSAYKNADGGIDIRVGNSESLGAYYTLTSNNMYTLVADPQNPEAKNRLSDTLTWKSTNTKVATVKANAGSYTATLKTLKKGTTKIEVTSKITKKLIARWTVIVNATGEASYYFGDWEPDEDNTLTGGTEFGEMELLTLDNPLKVTLEAGQGKVVKFTAPEYGKYKFRNYNWYDEEEDWYYGLDTMRVYKLDNNGGRKYLSDFGNEYSYEDLQKGEVRYIEVANLDTKYPETITIQAEGTIYDTWNGIGEYSHKGGLIAFTAPEDNYYVVKNSDNVVVKTIGGLKAGETTIISLYAGTYTVEKREPVLIDEKGLTAQNIESKTTNWYVFTAPNDMSYTFGLSSTDSALILSVYDDIMSELSMNSTDKVQMEKGKKVYISVKNESLDAVSTDITVKADAIVGTAIDVTKETSTSVTLEKAGKGSFVQYTIPEDGYYRFKASGTREETAAKAVVTANVDAYLAEDMKNPTDGIELPFEKEFKKGDVVYVYITTSDDKTTAEIKVAKINVKDIKFGDNENTLSSDYSYYKFTAESDGDYTFKATITKRTGENEITPDARVYSYKGNKFGMNDFPTYSYTDTAKWSLKKGDIIYLRVKTTDTENKQDSANIIVSKLEAEVFTTTWTGKLADGEEKWLQFKASEDTVYSFTCVDKRTNDGKGAVEASVAYQLSNDAYTDELGYASKYYKAGQTIYLKLEALNGAAECTVTAKPVVPEAVPAAVFTVAENSERWFVFTASEKARYSVKLTGNDAAYCTMYRYKTLASNDNFVSNISEIALGAGETVYYKVVNNSDADRSVTLSIAPVAMKALNLTDKTSDTVSLAKDNCVWYSFKAETAGRYSFNTSEKAAEGEYAYTEISYYTDAEGKNSIAGVSNPEKAVLIKANETIYVKVQVRSADASVTTSVKAIKLDDITAKVGADVTKTEANLAANSYKWYEIKGEGTYTIAISDVTEGASYGVWSVQNNGSSFKYDSSLKTTTITLGKGDVYTIVVNAQTDKMGYKLTCTMRDVKDLTLDAPVAGSLKTGEELYVSFKVPEYGRYAVRLDGLKDGVTYRMSKVSGSYSSTIENNNYCTFVSNINDKITFKITVTSAESVNFNVKAELVSAADITESGSAVVKAAETPAGYINWYSYTAAETGKYIVKASDTNATVRYAYGSEPELTSTFEEYYPIPQDVTLKAGVTYYYAVYYNTKPQNDVTFSVVKAAANKLEKEYTIDVSKLLPNEKTYISFTAPADGRYVFASSNDNVYADIYNGINDINSMESLSFNTDRPMKAEQELIFAVRATELPKDNVKISVSSIVPEELKISTEDKPNEIKKILASNEVLWVSFTAGETARYKFEMTNTNETRMYKKFTDENASYVYESNSYSIDKGQTVYLKLIPNEYAADESGKVSVGIKATVDTQMQKLTVGNENEVKDIAAGNGKWAYFTAETAGFYKFDFMGQCSVEWNTNEGNSGSFLGDSSFTWGLGKGDSIYFEMLNDNGITETITEKITITKELEVKELAVGASDNVKPDPDNNAWYAITATEKGLYNVTVSNSNNDGAYIYVRNNLNSWENSYYKTCALQLDKDEVKYIRIQTSIQDFVVTCTKSTEQVLTDSEPLKLTMQKGEFVLVKWTAKNEGYYRIKYTSGKNVSYRYYYNASLDSSSDMNSSLNNAWTTFVQNDEMRYLLIGAQEDDTLVTVSVEPLKIVAIEGEGRFGFDTLNKGDAILIKWTAVDSGSFRYSVSPNESVRCEYYINGLGNRPNAGTSWQWEEARDNQRYILIEALYDDTDVILSVKKEVRDLSVGSNVSSKIAEGDIEEFTFTAPEDGNYLFYSKGNSSTVEGWIESDNEYEGDLASVYSGGRQDRNFYITRYLHAGETVRLYVTKVSEDDWSVSVCVGTQKEAVREEITQSESYSQTVSTEYGQEAWFVFTARELGMYEFNSDYSVGMKLYINDTNVLLGKKDEYSSDSIRVWIDEDTEVLLRTWYGSNHGAGTYMVSVDPTDLQSYDTESSLNCYSGTSSTYVLANSFYQQTEVRYTYSQNVDETGVKLRFYTNGDYDDIKFALYLGDGEIPEITSDTGELEYIVDSEYFESIRVVVWRDGYNSFSGDLYCKIEGLEFIDDTMNDSQYVYIPPYGNSVVTYGQINEDGKYVFYSHTNAEITGFINRDGEEIALQLKNEVVSDTGFQYTLDLNEGDSVRFILGGETDYISLEVYLYAYKVNERVEQDTISSSGQKKPSVSEQNTIKIIEYTIGKAGKYTFTPSTTENKENSKFELTVGGETYTGWDIPTNEEDLQKNDKVIFKLWNMDKYNSVSATLDIAYVEPETEPEESSSSTESSSEESSSSEEGSDPSESSSPEEGSDPSESSSPEEGSDPSESSSSGESSDPSEETPSDSSSSGGEDASNNASTSEEATGLDVEEIAEDETM